MCPNAGKLTYLPFPGIPLVQYLNCGNDSTTKHVTDKTITTVMNIESHDPNLLLFGSSKM